MCTAVIISWSYFAAHHIYIFTYSFTACLVLDSDKTFYTIPISRVIKMIIPFIFTIAYPHVPVINANDFILVEWGSSRMPSEDKGFIQSCQKTIMMIKLQISPGY